MRYLAVAIDYDGTLAVDGRVAPSAVRALERLRASGRRAILVTGRRLDDLVAAFPRLDLFDGVVAENGAVLHWPSRKETTSLCSPVPQEFVRALQERRVTPLEVGRVIVATRHPYEYAVVDALYHLGLELQLIFNGEAVMVLPAGVNKATGLTRALLAMGLSRHEVVAIGNAANDHSFLELAECAVAVASADSSLKARAVFVTRGGAGDGVVELVDELIYDDLRARSALIAHDAILLGTSEDGAGVDIPAYGRNLLVAGPSGSGKSTFATGLIERLIRKDYQVCIVDPEGDYSTLDDIVTLGSRLRAPLISEVLDVMQDPSANVVVNLLGVALDDRPAFFAEFLPRLLALRARTGRPHWLVVDEVHHLWPAPYGLTPISVPQKLGETVFITVNPSEVAPSVLPLVDVAVAVGPSPYATLQQFAHAIGAAEPEVPAWANRRDEVIAWFRREDAAARRLQVVRARSERLRHLRKYAEGNLGPRSFIFRGPEGRLALKAQNLVTFCQLAQGVDLETWLHHLGRAEYSRWIRAVIKDEDLAREVEAIERESGLAADQSRRLVHDAIDRRYTLPA